MVTEIRGDLIVRGHERRFEGEVFVEGLVEVSRGGRLVCEALRCLGMIVEAGGVVVCREVVTNALEVDNSDGGTRIEAEHVRARAVRTVQLGLDELLRREAVAYEYLTHFGNDLNPSWDYEKGSRTLLGKEYRSACTRDSQHVEVGKICGALRMGKNPFTRGEPLVSARPRAPAEPRIEAPMLAEMAAWWANHPGPQRRALAELEAEWLARLQELPAEVRAEARRRIVKLVTSPKLAASRDALLAKLAG